MIIGSGMLAQAFQKYAINNGILIFASGVSNSQEIKDEAFQREKTLLEAHLEKFQNTLFIYFSTCSIQDPSMQGSRYVLHKLEMENLIERQHKNYHIFRLPQVVGHTKSPTIIHFLYDKIIKQEPFDIWANSMRNLIDVQDIVKIVDAILSKSLYNNEIVNIASPFSINIQKIVHIIENITKRKAKYKIIDKGASYTINIAKIIPMLSSFSFQFDENYIKNIIEKYYKNQHRLENE